MYICVHLWVLLYNLGLFEQTKMVRSKRSICVEVEVKYTIITLIILFYSHRHLTSLSLSRWYV